MPENASNTALKRCDEHIAWYSRTRSWMRYCHYTSQVCVVILTASVPILAVFADESFVRDATSPIALLIKSRALPATLSGVAAMIVTMSGIFQWHKKWLARAYTCELLKSERVKFETRAGDPYISAKNEDEAVRLFVLKIEEIAVSELEEWKQLQRDGSQK
jgi:hypothetical protein